MAISCCLGMPWDTPAANSIPAMVLCKLIMVLAFMVLYHFHEVTGRAKRNATQASRTRGSHIRWSHDQWSRPCLCCQCASMTKAFIP